MPYLLFFCLFLSSCLEVEKKSISKMKEDQALTARQEILDVDKAMSKMAVEEGFHKSLLAFASDSAIKPENGVHPIIGRKALEAHFAKGEDTKALSWIPTHAEAASSGDLGYTFGNWTFAGSDTTRYGNYFTAWKRQADGKWKWTLDGGNNTPAPR